MVYGKDQPMDGSNNTKWKGGRSEQWYRKLMAEAKIPVICIECGKTEKVYIHHKNHDHYDNRIENLEFRCPKCHKKEHPQESYWKNKKFEELHPNIQKTLKKNALKKGHNIGLKNRFQKGQKVWWQLAGYKSSKEAIIAKRGYWLNKKET